MKAPYTTVFAIGALGFIAWMYQAAGPDEVTSLPSVPATTSARREQPAMPSSPQTANATRNKPIDDQQAAAQELPVVRLVPDQVLATVGKEPIELRDLMPVPAATTESKLTPEEYRSRLQRAIDMEVVFQAARAQGVELTEVQKQRLEKVTGGSAAELAHYKKYGLSWSSTGPEQAEFEKRLLAAQMLEQNMVAKKATVAPSPVAEVQARYEQARTALLKDLHDKADIAIADATKGL